jgi:hypothetical protein
VEAGFQGVDTDVHGRQAVGQPVIWHVAGEGEPVRHTQVGHTRPKRFQGRPEPDDQEMGRSPCGHRRCHFRQGLAGEFSLPRRQIAQIADDRALGQSVRFANPIRTCLARIEHRAVHTHRQVVNTGFTTRTETSAQRHLSGADREDVVGGHHIATAQAIDPPLRWVPRPIGGCVVPVEQGPTPTAPGLQVRATVIGVKKKLRGGLVPEGPDAVGVDSTEQSAPATGSGRRDPHFGDFGVCPKGFRELGGLKRGGKVIGLTEEHREGGATGGRASDTVRGLTHVLDPMCPVTCRRGQVKSRSGKGMRSRELVRRLWAMVRMRDSRIVGFSMNSG